MSQFIIHFNYWSLIYFFKVFLLAIALREKKKKKSRKYMSWKPIKYLSDSSRLSLFCSMRLGYIFKMTVNLVAINSFSLTQKNLGKKPPTLIYFLGYGKINIEKAPFYFNLSSTYSHFYSYFKKHVLCAYVCVYHKLYICVQTKLRVICWTELKRKQNKICVTKKPQNTITWRCKCGFYEIETSKIYYSYEHVLV